jgi:hypothetical protein
MGSMIEVGGKEYQVVKTGRAQAEQVLGLSRWIARHGIVVLKKIRNDKKEIVIDEGQGIDFLVQIVENLSADALIDLFEVLVGCSKEDAEVYFDVATLIDVAITVYDEQPSVRRLAERFFSAPNSPEAPVSDESSMASEHPMDGQTTPS